ncbi:flagellin [Pseudoroseomonas globiformis]|uniref:Flagellin n=1 Tax=Teichococcus globiformis TaxID=2307229 RepID=A0ABV7G0G1_9PROT
MGPTRDDRVRRRSPEPEPSKGATMVSSILTNNGAMTALQSLKSTQKSLLETQNRISTGLKVSNAKDNAATWAVATSMRSDISNFKQVSENLSLSSSVLSTAQTGGEAVASLITEIKSKITAAQQGVLDGRTIQADIDALVKQVESTVQGSALKGVNLMNGQGTERMVASVNLVDGASVPSYIDVDKVNLSTAAGGKLSELSNLSVVSRGDQFFNDANLADVKASEKAMGTTYKTFDVNDNAGTNGKILTNTDGSFKVDYKDAEGNARSLTVQVGAGVTTVAGLITALNDDKDFSALFRASGAADGLHIAAADRKVQSGKFEVTNIGGSKIADNGTVGDPTTGTTFTFQDGVALKDGETFTFNYKVGAESRTLVLKATNDFAAGTAYQAEDTVNKIEYRSIKLDDANIKNADGEYTGAAIGNALRAALIAADDFASGAAVGGTSLGVAAAAGATVTITADTDDAFTAFQPVKTDYASLLSSVDSLLKTATDTAASFGSAGKRVDMQKEFMDKLVDTLTSGVGALVDADMSEEAARLQALQVQEQLGTQALSIANQAPQSILALFGR